MFPTVNLNLSIIYFLDCYIIIIIILVIVSVALCKDNKNILYKQVF